MSTAAARKIDLEFFSTGKVAKKSTEPAPAHIPRAPTALTPEQESAVISRYLVLADQERLLRSNASLNN
jgi:hypothetical protein